MAQYKEAGKYVHHVNVDILIVYFLPFDQHVYAA